MNKVPEAQRCKCSSGKSDLNDAAGDQKVAASRFYMGALILVIMAIGLGKLAGYGANAETL